MAGLYDLYIKNDIMENCEAFFNQYLKEEGVPDEGLSEEERELVGHQVDFLLDMMTEIHKENPDDYNEVTDTIIDKLIGMCVVAKMNESRLCRLLNEASDLIRVLEKKIKDS